jgi:hypothetical protein
MRELIVPFLADVNKESPICNLSGLLDGLEKNHIDITPWPSYSYKPSVNFSMAYSNDAVFIKYYVSEKFIRAIYTKPNDPVYEDSCVEFFISFDGEKDYYNFEFNSVGTCRLGFGPDKNSRELLPEKRIMLIKHHSHLRPYDSTGDNNINWELTLIIPFEVFCYHEIVSLNKMSCRANFYKCGNALPDPHFLVWNSIESTHPNFHLPEFFGKIRFEN